MNPLESVALLVALGSPAAAVLAVLAGGDRLGPEARIVRVRSVAPAGAWLLLIVTAAQGGFIGLRLTPLVAVGGCGAALVATSAAATGAEVRLGRLVPVCPTLALTAVGVALAGAGGGGGVAPVALIGGLAIATAAVFAFEPPPQRWVPAGLAAAGIVATAVGVAIAHADSGRWSIPQTGAMGTASLVMLVGGAAFVVVAGGLGPREAAVAFGPRRPAALLVPAGLALGLAAVPRHAAADDLGIAVVLLAAAAVVAAGAHRVPVALGLVSLAAAAGPATLLPGALLLAAAAVLALALDHPWAWLLAVPGGVSLVAGVVDDRGRLAVAVALAAAVVAVLAAQGAVHLLSSPGRGSEDHAVPLLPAAVLGAWLVVLPGTWGWTGARLSAYDRGALLAAAAAVVAVALRIALRTGVAPLDVVAAGEEMVPTETPGARLVTSEGSATTPRPRRAARFERSRPRARTESRPRTRTWPGRRSRSPKPWPRPRRWGRRS